MKAIYVKAMKITEKKSETSLKYFIHSINENKDSSETKLGELHFVKLEEISDSAFKNAKGVKEVFFDENLKIVEKSAFENCEDLEFFACEGTDKHSTDKSTTEDVQKTVEIIENFHVSEMPKTFTIEAFAFKKCKNLQTVILPNCKKLVIEKSAFENCSSLRTVICSAGETLFTGNPFEDCPESLVFVCAKDSAIERFARENGYRYVNVQ